jgi:hypothetical protein
MEVNFAEMNDRSLSAIWFLGSVAEAAVSAMPTKPNLPVEIVLFADRPDTPIAVLVLQGSHDQLEIMPLDFDEAEMFREGRGTTLHTRILPQRGIA